MELRQLRYFVKILELGSLGRAALELDVGVSALSQQIGKLESELSTRLLNRTTTGVTATSAGLAFLHHAQLTLRQADNAVLAAHRGRMSGYVSVGLPPTTATVLALPLINAMRERYPDIQLHLVEMLSGHLAAQLNARQIDLAILFQLEGGKRWSVTPLLDEKLFVIASPVLPDAPTGDSVCLAQLGNLPLVVPSAQHGLRSTLVSAFERAGVVPNIIMEVDGLAVLMNAVRAGHAATIQPGAAAALKGESGLSLVQIADPHVGRRNLLATLSDDELSPAASFERLLVVLLYFSFFFGMYNGAMVAALTEVMPQNVRVVGFSLAFSLATAIFGGFTPAMSTFLVQTTGDKASPAYWLMFAAVCGLSATLVLYRGQKSWVAKSV